MDIVTEEMLRSARLQRGNVYPVKQDTYITPAAKEYASEQGIVLEANTWQPMSGNPVSTDKPYPYVDAQSGERYEKKPEDMTHLVGNRLVKKTHPRIAFRGELDVLQAEVIMLQTMADSLHKNGLTQALGEVLGLLRSILAAEVKEEPLPPFMLFGMDEQALRRMSHQVGESTGVRHPVPDYRMGEVCARLNYLRARVRQAELAAMHAFADGSRPDLLLAMNRASSAVYLLYCGEVKKYP